MTVTSISSVSGSTDRNDQEIDSPALPLYELIFNLLSAHIADGRVEPGLAIREQDIMTAFGVGRAPARMALAKLEGERAVRKLRGRGFVVSSGRAASRKNGRTLLDVELTLPESLRRRLSRRSRRQHIYPAVEQAVASCLIFGRFQVSQSALADHFGVSRTVTQEVLASLEKTGFVSQQRNGRWTAGPMTFEDARERYEIRRLLEPAALIEAAARLPRESLEAARDQVVAARLESRFNPDSLNRIELALHTDIVLQCRNRQMRNILRTCQLPLIVTYGTVVKASEASTRQRNVRSMLDEHQRIIELLMDGKTEKAAAELDTHIRHAIDWSLPHFADPKPLAPESIPEYLIRVDGWEGAGATGKKAKNIGINHRTKR
ncbi:MAG: GntR family transcriptional regulator [Rhodospirillales bacterium]|nr:GntR family transcriptional regulator [Rhodospirillales bacterium]